VHQQMVLQGRVTREALAANVAGKSVGVPAVDPQVLLQLVFVPEGLSTVGAFKRTETLPNEKVLQCRILEVDKREGGTTSRISQQCLLTWLCSDMG